MSVRSAIYMVFTAFWICATAVFLMKSVIDVTLWGWTHAHYIGTFVRVLWRYPLLGLLVVAALTCMSANLLMESHEEDKEMEEEK